MSERNDRIFAVPVIVEEKLQVAGTAVQNLLPENVQQIGNPFLQPFISAYPVEIRIWLNDMEMRVHGLVLIRVFLAQPHVGYRLPVSGHCLEIAVLYIVKTIFFNVIEKSERVVLRLFVPGRACIFAQSVDGESESVNLLFSVERPALAVQAPENSAVFLVIEAVDDFAFCAGCSLDIFFLAEHPESRRKRPQDACVEDGSFRSVRVCAPVAADSAYESTMLCINALLHPERQYVVLEFLQRFFAQKIQFSVHLDQCCCLQMYIIRA